MQEKVSISTPWSIEEESLLNNLVTPVHGLNEEEVTQRLKLYGPNQLVSDTTVHAFKIFLSQFANPLIFILVIAACLTGILHEWVDMLVIIFAILINTGLGFYQEYQAETTLATLKTYIKDRARVIRDNREYEIDATQLVPGDIIVLTYGSRIPADARLLETQSLRIDEAILTGESVPVSKKRGVVAPTALIPDRTNMVHAGTLVVDGLGTALITATANATEIGKIAQLVSTTRRGKTPLQIGVGKLSWFIFCIIILIVSGLVFLGISQGIPLLEMLVLAAAIAVGAVPEALPIALTVILAVGSKFIAVKKGIVRKLASAETLGSTTLIMTDKTGTLTEANMQLEQIFSLSEKTNDSLLEQALASIDVTSTKTEEGTFLFEGRPFEKNIAQAAQDRHLNLSVLFERNNRMIIPFNSTHKFSASRYNNTLYIMGAPDVLLKRSTLRGEAYEKIEQWIIESSTRGNRLIALAHHNEFKDISIDTLNDITFDGILAFRDPVRKEVPEAIQDIESRGMRVVMVTGDLSGTALAVANELGWKIHDHAIITGNELREKTDQELLKMIPHIKIFARVTPEDKLRIGSLYQQLGEIVAMTGDGVNDAPALKSMDIGISLGSASDVAKSAADLVLLDDNFQTISASITEGRRILANIQKTFMYLLSNSLDAVFVVSGSLLLSLPMPLNALQIIWVNLFTGSLPAIAFAFDENLEPNNRPTKYHREIFSKEVKQIALGIGTFTSILLFALYYLLIQSGMTPDIARTIFFVCFATYILVIAFSFRSLHRSLFSYNIFSNRKLNFSVLLAIGLTIATVTVPWLRNIFSLAPLDWHFTWIVGLWLVANIGIVEMAKWWFRKNSYAKKK